MSSRLLDAARELTGFDAQRVRAGHTVSALGTEGVGVRTLVEACRVLAPDLDIRARETLDAPVDDRPGPGIALIVVDPSSSVGEEEKALLDAARARVGTVALVCSRIDAFWEWPRTVREHRRLLDPFGTVPLFGVSAAAALGGAVDESGVDELIAWIRQALDAPAAIRDERARLAAGAGAVERLLGSQTGGRPADLDELLARRRELLNSRDRGRLDRIAALRAGLARARSMSSAELAAGVRELSALAAGAAPDTDPEHGEWLRQRWSELADRVRRATDERIDEVASTTLVGLDPEPVAAEPWADAPLPPDTPSNRRRRTAGEDALLVIIGASTGLGVGRLVVAPMASVQTLQWVSMPLTLLLGVALAAWIIRVRRAALDRSDRAARGVEQLTSARAAFDHRLGLRIAAAETRIAGQIGRACERRSRHIDDEVARLDDALWRLRNGAEARRERRRSERARAVHRELTTLADRLWSDTVGDATVENDGNR
ncbi:hypothetical protein [Gordonia aurantiaca]|uniref:hypothetical protein n=1 Tax=Gordonia sp. B21 TaxID=3151852 RepID=UPI003265D544